jgi:hypothetical protein
MMLGRWHESPDTVPWQCLRGTLTLVGHFSPEPSLGDVAQKIPTKKEGFRDTNPPRSQYSQQA